MKPREKVVTAEDVQSSLYYLHLSSPNDYGLLRSADSDIDTLEEEEQAMKQATNPDLKVHRDPLSATARETRPLANEHTLNPLTQTSIANPTLNGGQRLARKPVQPRRPTIHKSLQSAPALPPRRLQGPRAMDQRSQPFDNAALQDLPQRQNIDVRRWSEQPPAVPPRQWSNETGHRSTQSGTLASKSIEAGAEHFLLSSGEHCWGWEKQWEGNRASEAREEMSRISSELQVDRMLKDGHESMSLTLIRRYNNEQWNVAKLVDDFQNRLAPSDPAVGARVIVEINVPGYAHCNTQNQGSVSPGSEEEALSPEKPEDVAFRRHLQLAGSGVGRRQANSQRFSDYQPNNSLSRPSLEQGSQSSYSPRTSIDDRAMPKGPTKPYSIQSPWHGTCEFSTGIAGRSLKCKHSYISKNPMYSAGIASATVSELRFNLPSSKVLGSPQPRRPVSGNGQESKRSSIFRGAYHRRGSSHDSIVASGSYQTGKDMEPEDSLDLSLGQEHAGGGFGGKQAKLGKLIIHPEGLQMLDFIVAANMALWWKVYEKC